MQNPSKQNGTQAEECSIFPGPIDSKPTVQPTGFVLLSLDMQICVMIHMLNGYEKDREREVDRRIDRYQVRNYVEGSPINVLAGESRVTR